MSLDLVEKKAYLNATPQQREVVRSLLFKVLGILRAQYLSYQTSHWQAAGDSFYGDHLLFQRLYESVEEQIDNLAEKMVGYLSVDSVAIDAQAPLISEFCSHWGVITCPHTRGIQSEKDLQAALRLAYDGIKAAKAMTLGLDDLLMSFSNAHDANEYLLQQVLGEPHGGEKTATLVSARFHQPGDDWGMSLTAATDKVGDVRIMVGDPRLTWNGKDKTFHADASDLRWGPGQSVSITNPKTGNTALYRDSTLSWDLEGDVLYWILKGPFKTSLHIWND